MMGLVLAAWIGGRAMLWESPFASPVQPPPAAFNRIAAADPRPAPASAEALPLAAPIAADPAAVPPRRVSHRRSDGPFALLGSGLAAGMAPEYAFAHQYLRRTALRAARAAGRAPAVSMAGGGDSVPPFFPAPAEGQSAGRWSTDAWGFWRQGSDAAPISQGRVPIYGASQMGAVLQYRIDPDNARDPRLYLRAYHALVRHGESEVALGASARPLARVPVRVFGELRLTDGALRREARPSAFAVTELAPINGPYGTRIEAYAQGGWVGGTDPTLFADGQASVTREIAPVARLTGNALRVSLGAGAWGGAQEGAQRVDLGPTLRLDVTLGQVPARLSLDWRERVEGDAGPGSGAAVTLSTRF
jgi:hypothetical protein